MNGGMMLSKSRSIISCLILLSIVSLLPSKALAEDRKYQIHYALFKIYEAQKRIPEKNAELHELIKLKPNEASLHVILGNDLFSAQKYALAIAEFTSASRIDPTNADSQGMIGRCDMQLRRYGNAVAAYTNAIRSQKPGGTDYRPELKQAQDYVENARQQQEYKKQQILRKKDDDDDD